MRKISLVVIISMLAGSVNSQEISYKKKPTLSVNFILNDFRTADLIRANTLAGVLKNKQWSKFSEMGPGLAVNYYQGITEYVDFMATMGASIVDYTFKNRQSLGSDNFLLETDANVLVKLLSDKYRVTPYLSAGAGVSMYKVYWGAYIPFGFGLQVKLAENTFLHTQVQYRTGITELANNHFNYSLGFGTPIGNGGKK
ncbi:hypothetical protein EXU57_12945 [Segetibacter sp. 3557_3]|uniref:hypothetical protein n=1 Tax=Segetibacter sp. 3557_3 TaxID=2547429 RepID=UPI0010584750|nr:hypothetical protein [Segetibacter sp. 3557_3]TDH25605.1 hypothetical protein EXU57_12945 [Segetibacter sp. 3557_3]